jgi:hypothetical protein
MLTAKTGEWDQAEALDSGADDFLSKPFSYPVLLARLRALIRRGSGAAGATLTVGDVAVDTAARRCWAAGEELDLTAREFALLEYLAHRPGVVVGKTDLLRHVWDLHADGDTNVVEVYIGYLRRKRAPGRSGVDRDRARRRLPPRRRRWLALVAPRRRRRSVRARITLVATVVVAATLAITRSCSCWCCGPSSGRRRAEAKVRAAELSALAASGRSPIRCRRRGTVAHAGPGARARRPGAGGQR